MLDKIIVDHETGLSAAKKINNAFDAIDNFQASASIPGPTGPQGPRGQDGSRGPQGPASTTPGPTGADGRSAYDIWISNGNTGTIQDFMAAQKGPAGIQGPIGTTGIQGLKGEKGDTGPTGPNGKDGTGVAIQGSKTIAEILAITNAQDGDMWIATDTNPSAVPAGKEGDGYVHKNGLWSNAGSIQGPVGPAGPVGPTEVSSDANNQAILGTDQKIFVPTSKMSDADVKTAYENNPDTNVYKDADVTTLAAVFSRINGLGFDAGQDKILTAKDIMLENPQTLPLDPATISTDNRYITVANSYQMETALLKLIREDYINKDGSVDMESTYVPGKNQSVATKKYVDDNAGSGTGGTPGKDGLSAYEVWEKTNSGKTEADYLIAIKGADGAAGAKGTDGTNGTGYSDAVIDGNGHLTLQTVAADGSKTPADLGNVKGADGKNGTGISVKGSKDNQTEIKAIQGSAAGDMWIAKDTSIGWVSDGATPTVWTDAGKIQGPKGDAGTPGVKGDPGTPGKDGTNATGDKNIQSDWNQTNNTLMDFIKNKPATQGLPVFVVNSAADQTAVTGKGIDAIMVAGSDYGNNKAGVVFEYTHTGAVWKTLGSIKGTDAYTKTEADDKFLEANKDNTVSSLKVSNQGVPGDHELTISSNTTHSYLFDKNGAELDFEKNGDVVLKPKTGAKAKWGADELALKKDIKALDLTKIMDVKDTAITDVAAITETGVYYGGAMGATASDPTVDVANSPVKGPVMVMASKDKDGNFGYFLMGSDQVLHTGGKPNGGTAIQWAGLVQASDIGNIHVLMAGHDLAYYLEQFQKKIGALQHAASQVKKDPDSAGIVPVYSETAFEYIDIQSFIQNPADPGKDITDGTEHYVTFVVEAGKTLNSNTTWCWTKEQTPARMWTNAGKSKSVSPMELHAWINSGALIKIIKTGADWFVNDVIVPAVAHPSGTKSILDDGSVPMKDTFVPSKDQDVATVKFVVDTAHSSASKAITAISDITDGGHYEGTDLADAPAQGKINVTATKDAEGNIGLTLKDSTLRVYEGGIPHGGTVHWKHVAPDHLYGATVPADTLGQDGDLYFKV